MKEKNAPIVLIGPMDCECDLIFSRMEHAHRTERAGYVFYEGEIAGVPVVAVKSLIGMVNATVAATVAILTFSPRLLIIEGTAGAHDPALNRNDAVLGADVLELGSYYTPHREVGEGSEIGAWTCPGAEVEENGKSVRVRTLHSDPYYLGIAARVPYAKGKVRVGTIGSSDIWNRELDRIAYCREYFSTDCEEMESFAVAQVCRRFGVPMLAVRVISNNEYREEEKELSEAAGFASQEYCCDIVAAIGREDRK